MEPLSASSQPPLPYPSLSPCSCPQPTGPATATPAAALPDPTDYVNFSSLAYALLLGALIDLAWYAFWQRLVRHLTQPAFARKFAPADLTGPDWAATRQRLAGAQATWGDRRPGLWVTVVLCVAACLAPPQLQPRPLGIAGFSLCAYLAWSMVARKDRFVDFVCSVAGFFPAVVTWAVRIPVEVHRCALLVAGLLLRQTGWFLRGLNGSKRKWIPILCAGGLLVVARALSSDVSSAGLTDDFDSMATSLLSAETAKHVANAWAEVVYFSEATLGGVRRILADYREGYGRDWHTQLVDVVTGTHCYCSGRNPAC